MNPIARGWAETSACFSRTMVGTWCEAKHRAADRPTRLAPTTMTGGVLKEDIRTRGEN